MKAPVFNPDWPSEVVSLYNHDMQEIWDPTLAPQVWNQYHNQLAVYFSFVSDEPSIDVLDVGCAQGTLALLLAEAGHRVWAMDLRHEFLDYAKSRYESGDIEFIQGNVLAIDLQKKFDLIFANQIIEHLVYPLEMIARLKSLLKPGGRLIITTPNGAYLKNSLPAFNDLGDPAQWEDRQFTADGDGHFFAYYRHELIGLFKQAGFDAVQTRYFETPWISGHMKVRYLHGVLPVGMLKLLDKITLNSPVAGRRLAHQLLITGTCRY